MNLPKLSHSGRLILKWSSLLLLAFLLLWMMTGATIAESGMQPPSEQSFLEQPQTTQPVVDAITIPASKPIGAFHIDQTEFSQTKADYQMNATLNVFADPLEALDILAAAQPLGFKVVGAFGDSSDYQDGSGRFDSNKFKDRVNLFAQNRNALAPYIADGTFYAHMLFDEPCDTVKWGGQAVTRDQIKNASNYSKQQFPGLQTSLGVGSCMDILLPGDIDIPLAPYSQDPAKGTIDEYILEQITILENNGFVDPKIILSINVMTGGTPPAQQVGSDASYACRHDDVALILWWQWHGSEDFASVVAGNSLYQQAVSIATAVCANEGPYQLFLPILFPRTR